MNLHSRATMLTGMAFPLGAVLGAVIGVTTAPKNGQGFQDIVYALLWFIVTGAPVTMLTFWFSTRGVDWTWRQRKRAMLRMFNGAFLATGVLIITMWFFGRTGNGGFVFLTLPACALIVTLQARRILKV